MSQVEVAERASVSRSRIIAAEARSSLPTLDVCLRLAEALSIPLRTMVRAHVDDTLLESNPQALARLEGELWSGHSHWQAIAEHHGLRIESGRALGEVSPSGDLRLIRTFRGCFATRPRQRIVFRDRIIGEQSPMFALKGSPRGLGYNMNVVTEGEWVQHRVEFHRPWTPADGPFDFEFESLLPRAFVFEADEANRRRRSDGLPPRRDAVGDFRSHVSHAFEHNEIRIAFPKSYAPAWEQPNATWGNGPLGDADYLHVDAKTCQSMDFHAEGNEARLTLSRPVPGYTFGIRWSGLPWEPTEGERS